LSKLKGIVTNLQLLLRPYSESKLELNSEKRRTRVMQKFFRLCLFLHLGQLMFEFCQISLGKTTDKLAINWQNFAQVGLQLKFAFRIWNKIYLRTRFQENETKPL